MKLALFFTTSISLQVWEKNGVLSREIKPYIELSHFLEKIYFITYGGVEDLKYQKFLPPNIRILPNKWNVPHKLYSFLIPFFYRSKLLEVDVYKTNQMSGSWAAVIGKILFKKKLVIRCGYEVLNLLKNKKRFYFKKTLFFFIEWIVYRAADNILLTSSGDKKFLERTFLFTKNKIQIIPNYIDIDLFKKHTNINRENSIIYVGRLHTEKNLLNFLEATEGLNYKIVFIGDGPLKSSLMEISLQKNIQVEFKGIVSNNILPHELNKSSIFVLPSFHEGCPKSLLEAMSCELPCLGTDVEGINNIIIDAENGYLCKTDKQSIREALKKIILNSKSNNLIKERARKTIESDYSLKKIVDLELNLYQRYIFKTSYAQG